MNTFSMLPSATGHLHLDPLWSSVGAETSERRIYCRAQCPPLVSFPQPTTGIQVVWPAAPHTSTHSLEMPAEQKPGTEARLTLCRHSSQDLTCTRMYSCALMCTQTPTSLRQPPLTPTP